MVIAIILSVLSALAIFGSFFFIKKQITGSVGAEREALTAKIEKLNIDLEALEGCADIFVSQGQLNTVTNAKQSAESDLAKCGDALKDAEKKLETAQKAVEEKETKHQELKSTKENEQSKLAELASAYETESHASVELEKKIAASLTELDTIIKEVKMTSDQKGVLDNLSRALTGASSRLRDLIGEYNTVNERLEMIKAQHLSLEEEYTRLVEQQLGGS